MKERHDVVIAGAGITGLSAAFKLRQLGIDTLVIESDSRVGGRIQSHTESGFLWESGPNTLMSKDRELWELIELLGLDKDIEWASPDSKKRYIVRRGRLVPLPFSPMSALTSPFLSPSGKLRLLAEPLVRGASDPAESVDSFVRRRFGAQAADYLFNPFVRGIYAGMPEKLMVQSAFPRLFDWEREHGSVIGGALRHRSPHKRRKTPSPIFSFRGGLDALPRALCDRLGPAVMTRVSLRSVEPLDNGDFALEVVRGGRSERMVCRCLILTLPAFDTAALLAPLDPPFAAALSRLEYPPLKVIFSAFRRNQVGSPLDGFGFLAPACEKRFVLGALYSSSLFAGRSPPDFVTLTAMIGGASEPEKALLNDELAVAGMLGDFSELLGIEGKPSFVRSIFWRQAIPQYDQAHAGALRLLSAVENRLPGLIIAGNFRNGISVGACVSEGWRAAEAAAKRAARDSDSSTSGELAYG